MKKYIILIFPTIVIIFITLPLFNIIATPKFDDILVALRDKEVVASLKLSIYTSVFAAFISLAAGTPTAYFLARREFPFKRFVEGIIDLPLMIPHPVIGLAILSIITKNYWFGKILNSLAIEVIGSVKGIIIVLTYVSLPFYINTVKAGIKLIPERLEKVSRSLGKSPIETFFRVTLPLSYKSILEGMIMAIARAISEFGAVIVIAYHPMIAPVMIYEKFTSFGLKYSAPVAVSLIALCLALFILMRVLSQKR